MTDIDHVISMVAAGKEVTGFLDYRIAQSMNDDPGTFAFKVPLTDESWEATEPDLPMQIRVDGTPVLTGFIEASPSGEGETIDVSGCCRLGRLRKDYMPGVNFAGLNVEQFATLIASPLFKRATLSNARNRSIVRGKGKKARAGNEPVKLKPKAGTRIEPGTTRGALLDDLCEQSRLCCFSSGDGNELILTRPNYHQEPQFRFFRARPSSPRFSQKNVIDIIIPRSTEHRFSRVIVVGSGQGTDANFGKRVGTRYGEAKDNPDTVGGEGRAFTAPKTVLLQRSVSSSKEAEELAVAELSARDAEADTIVVHAKGHGQVLNGRVTLFALDTMCVVEDEITGRIGEYLITALEFTGNRTDGARSELTLVPGDSELGHR